MENKRGRKGQYGGVTPLGPWLEHERPSPPEGMPEPEAKIWRDTVGAMKPRWFGPETFPLLTQYCFAVWACDRLAERLRLFSSKFDEDDLANYDRMTKTMLKLATVLRLTPKSNREGVVDGRDAGRGPKPWEWTPDSDRPPRKLWERDSDDDREPPRPWEG